MDQLLDQARSIWEGEIDFEGQRLADLLTYALLSLSGAIAFLVGFSTQNIYQTLYIGLGGTALTFLAVVPPWPFYNQHPLPWLQARDTGRVALGTLGLEGIGVEVDGQRVS